MNQALKSCVRGARARERQNGRGLRPGSGFALARHCVPGSAFGLARAESGAEPGGERSRTRGHSTGVQDPENIEEKTTK